MMKTMTKFMEQGYDIIVAQQGRLIINRGWEITGQKSHRQG
jgi:hypothetical protein